MCDPPTPEPTSASPTPPRRRLPPWLAKGDVHEWIKTGAVVVAAFWGVYTFIWKDILVPSWAPAALVIEVKPRQESFAVAEPGPRPAGPARLRLRVSATNPSTRTLYMLPNAWWASTLRRQPSAPGMSFETAANGVLQQPSVFHAERGQDLVSDGVLATGRLFNDDQIQPGETVSRDLSIALPRQGTAVVFQLVVPTVTRNPRNGSGESLLFGGKRLSWSYSEAAIELLPMVCSQARQTGVTTCESVKTTYRHELWRFDRKAVIFSKVSLLND